MTKERKKLERLLEAAEEYAIAVLREAMQPDHALGRRPEVGKLRRALLDAIGDLDP